MEPRLILIGTVSLIGLGYHFIFLAQPEDFYSLWQRIFPFLYWVLVGVAIARGVALIDKVENNVMIIMSLSVAAMTLGIVVGHVIVKGLRARVTHIGENVYREVEDEVRSGRGHSTF